jgi:hypothetical protein
MGEAIIEAVIWAIFMTLPGRVLFGICVVILALLFIAWLNQPESVVAP